MKVEFKKEITGGEYQDIQDVLINDTEQGANGEVKVSGSSIAKMRDKSIELIVLSVNGKKENILQEVRNLSVKDYNKVIERVNQIRDGINPQKKTK